MCDVGQRPRSCLWPHPQARWPEPYMDWPRTYTMMLLFWMAYEWPLPLMRGHLLICPSMGRVDGEATCLLRGTFQGLPRFRHRGGVKAGAVFMIREVIGIEVTFGVAFLNLPQWCTIDVGATGGWTEWGAQTRVVAFLVNKRMEEDIHLCLLRGRMDCKTWASSLYVFWRFKVGEVIRQGQTPMSVTTIEREQR